MAVADTKEQAIVRRKVVDFLHEEIYKRYRVEHLAKIPAIKEKNLLKGIEQKDIDRLQDLFTSTIYPRVEDRHERDRSFESLVKLLKSPRRMAFIIPSIPSITLRYATIFPTALKIGLNTVLSYTLSNKLEDQMVDALHKIYVERGVKIDEKLEINFDDYREAYVEVPYGNGKRMIGMSSVVMKAGKDMRLVNATGDIMKDVQNALIQKDRRLAAAGRPTEHEDDIDAIGYGIAVIDKVKETFGYYSGPVMDRMIESSYITEIDYLDRMYGV